MYIFGCLNDRYKKKKEQGKIVRNFKYQNHIHTLYIMLQNIPKYMFMYIFLSC